MAATKNRRQPVHLHPNGKLMGRDAIWTAIRELKKFTINDLDGKINDQPKTQVNVDTIKTYVTGLTKAEYLKPIAGIRRPDDHSGRYTRKRWELINDVGVEAPRVTKNGTPVTQGRNREQMWQAMKILSSFDFRELAANASTEECRISEGDAKIYIQYLAKARYLARLSAPINKKGIPGRYKLLPSMRTGPKPPMIQRIKQVYDPNLDEVMWPIAEGEGA